VFWIFCAGLVLIGFAACASYVNRVFVNDRDFTAERRSHVTVVDMSAGAPPSELESAAKNETERLAEEEKNKQFLTVPRRCVRTTYQFCGVGVILMLIESSPKWNKSTSPAELAAKERESFLEWRRNLSMYVSIPSWTLILQIRLTGIL
jgi:hypothetical protein